MTPGHHWVLVDELQHPTWEKMNTVQQDPHLHNELLYHRFSSHKKKGKLNENRGKLNSTSVPRQTLSSQGEGQIKRLITELLCLSSGQVFRTEGRLWAFGSAAHTELEATDSWLRSGGSGHWMLFYMGDLRQRNPTPRWGGPNAKR